MKNKAVVLGSIVALVVGFIAVLSFYKDSQAQGLKELTHTDAPFIRDHSTKFGDNKKGIYVVEFIDPECEACAYYHPVIKELFRNYYEDIQLVIRYLDNHKNSKFAVRILEASKKQNMYKPTLDMIYASQGVWAQHGNPKPLLLWEELKKVEGLDVEKLKKDFENTNVDEIVKLDRQDATALQVRGTPTIFVNGEKLEKLSYQGLFDLVESKLFK